MAQQALVWDKVGDHFFETGIDHCALYPAASTTGGTTTWGAGVAWNGITSVSESPSGADEQAFYADNIKYLSLRGIEEFGGSIGAYTYPDEFAECDGSANLSDVKGVTIGQQHRKAFCLAYRTRVGNDLDGDALGYKLHIIYNATVSPSDREFATVNDSPEPIEMSWEFTTNPIPVTGHQNTSIVTIDSTKLDTAGKTKLAQVETALFGKDPSTDSGSDGIEPHVLLPDEIAAIFTAT